MVANCLPACITFLAALAGLPAEPEPVSARHDSDWEEIGGRLVWTVLPWVLAVLALVAIAYFIYRVRRMDAARREAEARVAELRGEREHLLAMLANDLNNPLQTIRLACDSLSTGAVDEKTLAMLRQTVERMARLVKNVLNTTALNSGQAKFDAQDIELSTQVAAIVAAMQPRAQVKQIALSFQPGPGRVRADADAFAQIVDELVGNALKFTPRGGRIEVAVQREGRHIELRVGDSGPGIGADELPRLFAKQTGSTHGLAIVRRLVEAMDGIVFAESPAGAGATIRVRLPEVAAP